MEEAWQSADSAVTGFSELGAHWERASALANRGNIGRLMGRLSDATADLRESLALCRTLKDHALIAWTSSELARVLIVNTTVGEASSVLHHPSIRSAADNTRISLANTAALVALAAGEHPQACAFFHESLQLERERGWINHSAAQVWVTAHFCGEQAAGGPEIVSAAQDRLRSAEWLLVLDHPATALA